MYVFKSFGELHFQPTFDAGPVRHCITIVMLRSIGDHDIVITSSRCREQRSIHSRSRELVFTTSWTRATFVHREFTTSWK